MMSELDYRWSAPLDPLIIRPTDRHRVFDLAVGASAVVLRQDPDVADEGVREERSS